MSRQMAGGRISSQAGRCGPALGGIARSELTLTELALGPASKPERWAMVRCECEECER
jgi:hypothetical protein